MQEQTKRVAASCLIDIQTAQLEFIGDMEEQKGDLWESGVRARFVHLTNPIGKRKLKLFHHQYSDGLSPMFLVLRDAVALHMRVQEEKAFDAWDCSEGCTTLHMRRTARIPSHAYTNQSPFRSFSSHCSYTSESVVQPPISMSTMRTRMLFSISHSTLAGKSCLKTMPCM